MLVLKRREGDWVEITHRSGDVLRIRSCEISGRFPHGQLNLAFDDPSRNFEIERPERGRTPDTLKTDACWVDPVRSLHSAPTPSKPVIPVDPKYYRADFDEFQKR